MSDIVFCGVNDWQTIKQRPQHLAERLSNVRRVLYVNPIGYSVPTHVLRSLRRTVQRRWRSVLEPLTDRLWLFTPIPALPFSRRLRVLNRLNQAWLAWQLRPVLRQLEIVSPLLWLSFPTDVDLVGHLSEQCVVFDCMDNYPSFFNARVGAVIAAMEHDLLSKADLVLATSRLLLEKCRRVNANAHFVPNGVDVAHFACAHKGLTEADEIQNFSHPRFGYIGTIGPWTDVDSMIGLAHAVPDSSVIVIGPWEVPQPSYLPANMYILGPRPYSSLPEYLAGFDVALIPFKIGPLTQAINPVKLFEYAAAGVPIVATRTQELAHYEAWCVLADSPQDWIELAVHTVQKAISEEIRSRAAAEAAANDWNRRVETISQLIASCYRHSDNVLDTT